MTRKVSETSGWKNISRQSFLHYVPTGHSLWCVYYSWCYSIAWQSFLSFLWDNDVRIVDQFGPKNIPEIFTIGLFSRRYQYIDTMVVRRCKSLSFWRECSLVPNAIPTIRKYLNLHTTYAIANNWHINLASPHWRQLNTCDGSCNFYEYVCSHIH